MIRALPHPPRARRRSSSSVPAWPAWPWRCTWRSDRPVVVLAKRQLDEGATAWAQGGIVGVLGDDDSVESHVRDTQDAGAGLVDEHTARFIAEHSAQAVEWLVAQGVPFSADPSGPLGLHLTREGGHAVRRIAHAADATGKAIHDALLAKARAHPNISAARALDGGGPDHLAPPEARRRRAAALLRRLCARHGPPARRDAARRRRWCWPPAASARSTATPATPTPPPATASPWPGAPAAASATWSSSSSTRPACTTRRSAAS